MGAQIVLGADIFPDDMFVKDACFGLVTKDTDSFPACLMGLTDGSVCFASFVMGVDG